jgi:hypothetical protein
MEASRFFKAHPHKDEFVNYILLSLSQHFDSVTKSPKPETFVI